MSEQATADPKAYLDSLASGSQNWSSSGPVSSAANLSPVHALADIVFMDRESTSPPTPSLVAGPALSVDATAGQHPISPYIYGINYASESIAADLRLPVRRWGGNSTSRYNWQNDTTNTGSDWYFENVPEETGAADQFVQQDRRTGTKTLLTIPLIGWVAKTRPTGHPYDCGFKISKYGNQNDADWQWDPDCGNGVQNGTNITGNDPHDTSVVTTPSFVSAWVSHLTSTFGTAANGGVMFYNLDNEPMLWNSTHRDVHPNATTYDEMRDRTWVYAAAIKSADPTAKTLGPVVWGWCAYFYSAADGCGPGADHQAHGNLDFVEWYLQQMRTYEQQHGIRILDYLDVHIYPQIDGVYSDNLGSVDVQAKRLRSTRQLWDSAYVHEGWIGQPVYLIPRMRQWAANDYPGTKLAITEYNWGALGYMNGALAQVDLLGIFGREGLDLATLWGPPDNANAPGIFAFRMYRNYDGQGSAFGENSILGASANQDKLAIYAARRSQDGALTVIVINKTGTALTSPVTLTNFQPGTAAKVFRYSSTNLTAIVHEPDQAVSAGGFSAIFPANSITLFAIPAAANTSLGSCTLFPANNIWNTRIDGLPVNSRSGQWVDTIGRTTGFHMDFGSGTWEGGPIGIPFNIVDNSVPGVSVSFYYPTESDPGPYPIPANPLIEYGSDHHILMVNRDNCYLYEIYDATYSGGAWSGGSGAIWNLNSNALRPDTWTSADAAGLPILPGLVRYDEIVSGQIKHAIRFTASQTNGYIWPARHLTSNDPSAPQIPPMGARFRLKSSYNISGFPAEIQVILRAMKQYGIILADNGSDWYVSGAPDERWDNDHLHLLDVLTGNDFEAVDSSRLMVNVNSGAVKSAIADFNGDGKTDISVFRPSNGVWYVNGQFSQQWGGVGDVPVPGDYNGDGATDVAVWRPSNGVWYFNGQSAVQYGGAGDIPVPGDYNGDLRTDVAVFRPSNGVWYVNGQFSQQWGGAGDIPVPGDYNGDGRTDLAVFRPSNGAWYVNGQFAVQYGGAGDIPIPGDYNGDGNTDVGVFRPSNGVWYVNGQFSQQWGGVGDIPVPGDYNGDNVSDVAVWRPSNGVWYVNGQFSAQYGGAGDFPCPTRDTNGDGDPYQDLSQ